jgi:hypothetical protein
MKELAVWSHDHPEGNNSKIVFGSARGGTSVNVHIYVLENVPSVFKARVVRIITIFTKVDINSGPRSETR